jgi:hypothetical protein
LAAEDDGLIILNIINPLEPFETGSYNTPDNALAVAVQGNYAYVADEDDGIRIIDIVDPNNPIEVSYYDTPGDASDVAVSGNYAFVADWEAGMRVLDISNPANPFEVGYYDPGYVRGIAIQDNYAYLAADTDGLIMVDISDPANPDPVYIYDGPRNAWNVAVAGNYIFQVVNWGAGYAGGLGILNVNSSLFLTEVGEYDTPGSAYGVAVSGNFAYIADGNNFAIYDCTPAVMPSASLELTPINPPIQIPPGGGSFRYNLLIINQGLSAITYDFWSEILKPNGQTYYQFLRDNETLSLGDTISQIMTQFVPAGEPAGIYTYKSFIGELPWYILASDTFQFEKLPGDQAPNHNYGWGVYGWDGEQPPQQEIPHIFCLYPPYPNPFNTNTRLTFALPSASEISLVIYDIQGREVVRLKEGFENAGIYDVEFSASELASGIYFARLNAGNFQQEQKLILIK